MPRWPRRQWLQGAALLMLVPARHALGAVIVAVRVWPARDYTRVTIESEQPLPARHQLVDNPPRLVIDIDGLELDSGLRELVGKVRPDDPYIAGARVGQFQVNPLVLRIVIDLKRSVRPQQFALPPVAAYRHRLVFDLFPTQEADPLLQLVRDKPAGADVQSAQAARDVQDALGDLIARIERPAPAAAAAASALPPPAASAPPPAASALPPAPSAPASAVAPPPPLPLPPAPEPTAAPLSPAEKRKVNRLIIVALDPGHGGEDPGAIGPTGLREKDVALAIALKLRDKLETAPGVRVVLTRDGDYFVPLQERVRKARRVQADLFVSIHADAFLRPEARGASVFALSERGATSTAARWMAERENSSDQVGGVNIAAKDAQLARTLLDMSTTAQIKDSLKVGREVLSHIGRVGRLHKAQVEQAGFAVLKAPDIPSILVETAFISNPDEEARLRDPQYRRELVDALARGIHRYFAGHPPLARQRQL